MNKICVIGVYFGVLPKYFSLWYKSCQNNPEVDFIIFTDNDIPEAENIKCHKTTLKEIKDLASNVLGFEACLNKPYKCCDYRPLYGKMFAKYIERYDYWGHCDFDVIFGDIMKFCNEYNLHNYDKFLTLGHLSLYRNTNEVNERYKCDGATYDYLTTCKTDKACIFDEIIGIGSIFIKNKFPIFTKKIFADISCIYYRYRIVETYQLDEKPKNYKWQIFVWENGKVYREYILKNRLYKEEYIYIHFKKRPNYDVNFNADECKSFYITNKGFIEKHGQTTKKEIRKYNKYFGVLYEWFENIGVVFKAYFEWAINKIKRVFGK